MRSETDPTEVNEPSSPSSRSAAVRYDGDSNDMVMNVPCKKLTTLMVSQTRKMVEVLSKINDFLANPKNVKKIHSSELHVIREYNSTNLSRFLVMTHAEFMLFHRVRSRTMVSRFTDILVAGAKYDENSGYITSMKDIRLPSDAFIELTNSMKSYEEVILMDIPHTFTADIDLSWENPREKGIIDKFFKMASDGLGYMYDRTYVYERMVYEEARISDGPYPPTPLQQDMIKTLWAVSHIALTIGRLSYRDGNNPLFARCLDTVRSVDVTIEACVVNKETLKADDEVPKYSFHIKTTGEHVRNVASAKMVAWNINIIMIASAIIGLVGKRSQAASKVNRLLSILVSEGAEAHDHLSGSILDIASAASPEHRETIKAFGKIIIIDMGFYQVKHNLRMPYEIKPGKDYYLYPYHINIERLDKSRPPIPSNVYTTYCVDVPECITATIPDDDSRRTGGDRVPSRPEFVKETVEGFRKTSKAILHNLGDGEWGIDYASHGKYCDICERTHEQSTQHYLRFFGGQCYLRCRRANATLPWEKSKGYIVARDEEFRSQDPEKRFANDIERMKDGHDDDERRRKAVRRILEGDDTLMSSHDMTIFTSPTLDADDDVQGKEGDFIDADVKPVKYGMTYIRSALGTGKTKWLLRDIIAKINRCNGHRFIVVSTRVVQTNAFLKKYNQFISSELRKATELKIKEGVSRGEARRLRADTEALILETAFVAYNEANVDVNADQNMIIQVDSLTRLAAGPLRDREYTLILDEAVSILEQTQSSNIRDYTGVCNSFKVLMGYAQSVILLDGHMTHETIKCYDTLRGLMVNARRAINRLADQRPRVYVNTYRPQDDRTYRVTPSRDDFLSHLAYIAGGAKRQRVIVASNSLECCKIIREMISMSTDKYLQGRVVKMYTSETAGLEKKVAFNDVDTSWAEADILIISPTVGAGISFEVAGHFDYLFGYCTNGSTTAETFVQLLNRVRDISENEACVYIDQMKTYGLYTTVPSIRTAILNDAYSIDTVHKTVNDDGDEILTDETNANGILRLYATAHENRSASSLMARTVTLLLHLSSDVVPFGAIADDVEKVTYKDLKNDCKANDYERFDNARVLSDSVYEDLKELKKLNGCTAEEGFAVDKTAMMKRYRMGRDFTENGWAAQYIPFLNDYAEKLKYVTDSYHVDYGELVETIANQVYEADGTHVSETVDKVKVMAGVMAICDFLGIQDMVLADDRKATVDIDDDIVTVNGDAKKCGRSELKEFVDKAPNFGEKGQILPSGKAVRWAKAYMAMHNEVTGFLSGGKKAAKNICTLNKRLVKGVFAFFGVDSIGSTFYRKDPIRFGDGDYSDDGISSFPRIVPLVDAKGHKYKRVMTGVTHIGADE
jgi:hypothetical protein